MARQLLLNLLLAFIWMFLHNSWDPASFLIGYLLGLAMLYLLRRFLPNTFYFSKVLATVSLVLLFLKELLLSGISVIKLLLNPKMEFRPGIFAFHTQLKSNIEITLLANLITLTPGTLTIEVSTEGNVLYIHAMDISDVEEVSDQIRNTFEKAIMEVTR
jgi:multicomponent Na+:H+ antiporter subunit E